MVSVWACGISGNARKTEFLIGPGPQWLQTPVRPLLSSQNQKVFNFYLECLAAIASIAVHDRINISAENFCVFVKRKINVASYAFMSDWILRVRIVNITDDYLVAGFNG